MNLLCFSSSDWEGKWGSRQQVMLRFARRGYRVLFVERPVGLEHLWRYPDSRHRKLRRWLEGLRRVEENLWIVSLPPLLPGRYYSRTINYVNQRLTTFWTKPYLRQLSFAAPILWIYNPEQGPLIGRFGERLSVYHCIDEFSAGTKGRKRYIVTTIEQELLRRVDVVFANSLLTYENKRFYNPHTYRIPSGVDIRHFAKALDPVASVHPSIATIPHPIAGYVGNINNKLDISLLAAVVAYLPDWQFVFVGQPYPQVVNLRSLQKMPNVHFLGSFPFEDVPALVKGIDVCLLPYADTELARYRSPLKLYECLAAGKPIVSTNHPEVREFAAWVEIASTPEEFADAIVRAKKEDSPARRRHLAEVGEQHSWDSRVSDMERILNAHLKRPF